MATPVPESVLGEFRVAIQAMTKKLEETTDLPSEGLADLKGAVDDVRIRLWGILMARDTSDYHGFTGRFRMRRAAECCQGVYKDVSTGRMPTDSVESRMLYSAARQLTTCLEAGPTGGSRAP